MKVIAEILVIMALPLFWSQIQSNLDGYRM